MSLKFMLATVETHPQCVPLAVSLVMRGGNDPGKELVVLHPTILFPGYHVPWEEMLCD